MHHDAVQARIRALKSSRIADLHRGVHWREPPRSVETPNLTRVEVPIGALITLALVAFDASLPLAACLALAFNAPPQGLILKYWMESVTCSRVTPAFDPPFRWWRNVQACS